MNAPEAFSYLAAETFPLVAPYEGITEISLREPTVDEIARVNDDTQKFGAIRSMKNLIAAMAGLEVATVGRMGARDFNACNKYLGAFFE